MADNKTYAGWIDVPDGAGGTERHYLRDDDAQAALLYPVGISTLTPSSTFVKNAVIGINGVIYRAKQATSHFPVVLETSGSAFVVHTVNGKMAFVVTDPTVHSDWEQWTDAAIEYWTTQLDARMTAVEATSPGTALQPTTTIGGHTVSDLLTAMASLMSKTVVTQ